MKYLNRFNRRHVMLAVAGASALIFASGCQTHRHSYSSYSSLPGPVVAAGGSESTSQNEYNASATASAEVNTGTSANVQASDQTVIPLYQESVRAGTREVDAGTVRLRKIVKTETVNQPVQIRRETVVIDRDGGANANAQPAGGQAFQEQEYVIHLKREEPMVETQVQQIGQIVARKQVQQQQQNVQRQIRHDEVDIVKQGNAQDVIISQEAQGLINGGAAGGSVRVQGEVEGQGQQRSDQP